jgi:hypothetical protein
VVFLTVGVQLDPTLGHNTFHKMSQPDTKKHRECIQQQLDVFTTIDATTGKYFSLGVYPHLPHTPTPDPTEHIGHASAGSGISLLIAAEGSNTAQAPHVAHSQDVEHAGLEAVAQPAAAGGGSAASVHDAVGGGQEFPEELEELILGEGHPGVDRKGEDKGLILQDSDDESPIAIDPSAPVQGNQPRGAPGAGETEGKWTKSK